jgi:protein gp37
MAKRLAGNPKICPEFRNAYGGVIPPVLIHTEITAPMRLKKPARIGVQFMGDLFHEDVPDEFIMRVFDSMPTDLLQPCKHTYLILTKRVKRMYKFFNERTRYGTRPWTNVWLGVTVCNEAELWKMDELRKIPASIHWVSFEPLLSDLGKINFEHIEWCVTGGETGPGARPLHPDWVRSVRDQCQVAGVPFFFKHQGEWLHQSQFPIGAAFKKNPQTGNYVACELTIGESIIPKNAAVHEWPNGTVSIRVGRKAAGRLLNGREWNELLEVGATSGKKERKS